MRPVHCALLASSLLGWVALARQADAETLLFEYSGVVKRVAFFDGASDNLGFSAGQTVNGAFVLDCAAVDQDPSGSRSWFTHAVSGFRFGDVYSLPHENNDSYSYFSVNADPQLDQVSAYLNTLIPESSDVFGFMLSQPDASSLLKNDQVDLLTLNIADFDLKDSEFSFLRNWRQLPDTPTVEVIAEFTGLKVSRISAVPAPSSLACLIGIGVIVGGMEWWKKRRRCRSRWSDGRGEVSRSTETPQRGLLTSVFAAPLNCRANR